MILVRIYALVVILVIKHLNIGFLNAQCSNYHHSKYLCSNNTSLNNINQNSNVTLFNDNSNFNNNSNVEYRTENSIYNSSGNSIIDHDNVRNLGNSNRINSDNYVDSNINNEYNNTRDLVNVTNSDSNENSDRNLDSSNNFISVITRGINSNSDESSSNWHVISFLVERENLIQ